MEEGTQSRNTRSSILLVIIGVLGVAIGLPPIFGIMLVGGVVSTVIIDGAIDAGIVHVQTYRVSKAVATLSAWILLLVVFGGSPTEVFVYSLPGGLALGWVTLDALTLRRTQSHGQPSSTTTISTLVSNVKIAPRVIETLEIADQPLEISEVGTICEVDEERAASVLAMLVDSGVVARKDDRYVIRESIDTVSPSILFLRGVLKRLVQPFRLLTES